MRTPGQVEFKHVYTLEGAWAVHAQPPAAIQWHEQQGLQEVGGAAKWGRAALGSGHQCRRGLRGAQQQGRERSWWG